jgi:hypothetical protein
MSRADNIGQDANWGLSSGTSWMTSGSLEGFLRGY